MIRRLAAAAALSAVSLLASANEVNPISVAATVGTARYTEQDASARAATLSLAYTFDVPRDRSLVNSVQLNYYYGGTDKPKVHSAFDAFGMSYKASYAMGPFALNARAGVATARVNASSKFGFTYGVGVSRELTKNLSATLQADRLPGKVNLITLGLNYAFE
ncbi:MAG: hypothetical protein ACXU8N_12360 [Telluria sp.]